MSAFDTLLDAVWAVARTDDGALLEDFSGSQTDAARAGKALGLPQLGAVLDSILAEARTANTGSKDAVLAAELVLRATRDPNPVRLFSQAVRLSPDGSSELLAALHGRACALLALREVDAALKDFSRVLGSSDAARRARAHVGVSSCRELKGEWQLAETALRAAAAELRDVQLEPAAKAALLGDVVGRLKRVTANLQDGTKVPPLPASRVQSGLDSIPALLGSAHSTFSSASSAVDLREDPERGRHLVANRDIPVGSVLVVEKPYAWSLSAESLGSHCLHCCAPVLAALPCSSCSMAVFCCQGCMDAAQAAYHAAECSVLHHLVGGKELSAMALLVYRTVVTAAGLSRDFLVNSGGNLTLPQPFLDLIKDKGPKKSKHKRATYRAVFDQLTHSSSRTPADLLKRSLTAAYLSKCLERSLREFGVGLGPEDETVLTTAFLRHLQGCSCNAYQISEHRLPGGDLRSAEGEEIGGAVYPTVSLINHACDPNVARHSHGNLCVVRALRRIRKGAELLDNYGPHFLERDLEERREFLEKQYFFRCACLACTQDWPLLEDLGPPAYKCAHCGGRLADGGALADLRAVRQCPRCKKKRNYNEFVDKVLALQDKFARAVQGLLEGRIQDGVNAALDYAAVLEEGHILPSAELARANQVASLCWSLSGNKVEF